MHRLRQKLIMQTEPQKQIIRMLPVETYTPFLFTTQIAQQNPLFLLLLCPDYAALFLPWWQV
jgi:hypothetical protein